MIAICFRSYAASRSKTAVQKNPLPPHKKEQRNTIPTPTVGWYRSGRRENSPRTSPIRVLPARIRIRRRHAATVTTSHLFWPNQPRRTTLLLSNWLRNLSAAAGEIIAVPLPGNQTSDFPFVRTPIGPRRGAVGRPCVFANSPRRVKRHGIF